MNSIGTNDFQIDGITDGSISELINIIIYV